MAGPWQHPSGIFYYRKALPTDLKRRIGELQAAGIVVTKEVHRSLETRNRSEAETRYHKVRSEVSATWDLWRRILDKEPGALVHRDIIAISGAAALEVLAQFEDEPTEYWQIPNTILDYIDRMRRVFRLPSSYDSDPLEKLLDDIPKIPAVRLKDYLLSLKQADEPRLRGYVDVLIMALDAHAAQLAGNKVDHILLRHGIRPDPDSLERLRKQARHFTDNATRSLASRLDGDYRTPEWAQGLPEIRAPSFQPTTSPRPNHTNDWDMRTYDEVIDAEEGKAAKGLRAPSPHTIRKYRGVAHDFINWRGGDRRISTMTHSEVAQWREELMAAVDNKPRTVRHKIATLKTLAKWGVRQSITDNTPRLFPDGIPIKDVELPDFIGPDSADRTYTVDEAQVILKAARRASNVPYLRWVPWILAYTGMRVGEALQLDAEDLEPVEGGGYILHIRHNGTNRRTKTKRPRRIPLHPALVREGLPDFMVAAKSGPIFTDKRMDGNIRAWVHQQFKEGLQKPPAHAFRHLFEDLMREAGLPEGLQRYITGRAGANSSSGYGYGLSWRAEAVKQIARVRWILSA